MRASVVISPMVAALVGFGGSVAIILAGAGVGHLLGMTKPVGAFQVSSLIWIEPLFEPTTFIGLGVPLTMASQNLPGFAFDNLQGEHTGHIGAAATQSWRWNASDVSKSSGLYMS